MIHLMVSDTGKIATACGLKERNMSPQSRFIDCEECLELLGLGVR